MATITTIFPTTIYSDSLTRALTDQEQSFINKIEYVKNDGNLMSKNNYVLEDPALSELKEELLKIANDYFKVVYSPKEDLTLAITQSWLNKTVKNENHHKHMHYNSFASGVLYLECQEQDSITFEKDVITPHRFERTEYHLLNSSSWTLDSIKNNVYMFPSILDHYVKTKQNEGERISLAFNCFFKGRLGTNNELTELHL